MSSEGLFPQKPPKEGTKPLRTLGVNQPELSNRAPRARPCGPHAGLLLPKLPHSRTVLSSSTGVADSQRVDGGWSRSSAAAPRGAGQRWAERRSLAPAGRPARSLPQPDELHARNFPLADRRRLRALLIPSAPEYGPRAAVPDASAAHPPGPRRSPAARPRVSAPHPAARASRPSPRPRMRTVAEMEVGASGAHGAHAPPGTSGEARGARTGRARAGPGRPRAACGRGRYPAAHSPPPWPSVRAGGGGRAGPRMRCRALIGGGAGRRSGAGPREARSRCAGAEQRSIAWVWCAPQGHQPTS